MHTQYNVEALLMIVDECFINNCCIWFIVLTTFEVIIIII